MTPKVFEEEFKLNEHLDALNRLTDFLEMVKERCQFRRWFAGHYHTNQIIDERFVIQWEQISHLE